LLPFGEAEGFVARLTPYRSTVAAGGVLELAVEVSNPFDGEQTATVRLVLPDGWTVEPAEATCELPGRVTFAVVAAAPAHRVPVAADVTIGDTLFGQQAEALVTVT